MRTMLLAAACIVSTFAAISVTHAIGQENAVKPPRFFELRIYTTHEGKLEALHKRFREHTNRLFQKHGMELVGYWTPVDGPEAKNTLIYVLAYPSREARDKAWAAFQADPQWIKARDESHKDGVIVSKVESKFMDSTDYSPIR
jgi:hypothetical protein